MVTVIARAKVNYTLDVLAKREDGYHELATVMQSIRLHDKLCIEPAERLSMQIETKAGVAPWLPDDERNDVLRAARLLQQRSGCRAGAHVQLTKYIPVQAGLGGGSADGAAALLGLNRLWQLGFSEDELADLAEELGSDCVFTLKGGSACCRGRGERIEPLHRVPFRWLVLFKPLAGMSTSRAFQSLDWREASAEPPATFSFLEAVQKSTSPFLHLSNHLRESVFQQIPELARFARRLDATGYPWQMSGSGSTLFLLAPSRQEANELRSQLVPWDWWSFVTCSSARGAEIVE